MTQNNKSVLLITGLIGLLASILVGIGEFLLHFDPLSRFADGDYSFMLASTDYSQTLGHFIGTLSAPFYVIGCWHIYLMLKPANQKLAFVAFLIGAYGFIIGGDWISSRASIGAIIHIQQNEPMFQSLVELYDLRYENLLTIIRITTLLLSLFFIALVLTGKSNYKKWHALFSPIVLLLSSFLIYVISPSIGKYMMPIALNVGFGLFFLISLIQVNKLK
jgi:hypothetical protein